MQSAVEVSGRDGSVVRSDVPPPPPDISAWVCGRLSIAPLSLYDVDCDRVILEAIVPIATEAAGLQLADEFFFVRYSESGAHLRFRLRRRDGIAKDDLYAFLADKFLMDRRDMGLAERFSSLAGSQEARFEWMPYEPELQRYGGVVAIDIAHEIFHASSALAVEILGSVRSRSERLGKAVLAMLVTVYAIGGQGQDLSQMFLRFGNGFALPILGSSSEELNPWFHSFERAYVSQAAPLAPFILETVRRLEEGVAVTRAFDEYALRLRRSSAKLADLVQRGAVTHSGQAVTSWPACLSVLLPSFMHMTNNRLGVLPIEEAYLAYLIHRIVRGES